MDFVKYNAPFLRLFNYTKSKKLAVLLLKMEYLQYHDPKRGIITGSDFSYQDVLDNHFTKIEDILINDLHLINSSIINERSDVSGFNVFNAESIPFFGENYIAVNSGVFYFAHVFARSIQPVLMENNDLSTFPKIFANIIQKWPRKNFRKAAFGYLTSDRRNAHMNSYLIPEDDSLLFGIELFVVGHEYAHILSKESIFPFSFFENYFEKDIIDMINSDEEIKADAFSMILLSRRLLMHPEEKWLLYAPLFLFDVLRYLDIIIDKKYSRKMSHPCHPDRYDYLQRMANCLLPNNEYEIFHNKLKEFVLKDADIIRTKVDKYNSKMSDLFDIYDSYHNEMYYALLKEDSK